MKKFIVITFLFISASLVRADEILISLYEYNPWQMVVGSDSPTFILYDGGLVIFWNSELNKYQRIELEDNEVNTELVELKLLNKLDSEYSLSNWTDQPTQVLTFKSGTDRKKISVYGNLRKEKDVRNSAPKDLLAKYDHFINYSKGDAKDWNPTHIEVMIWPYEYAPDKSVVWPHNWPDIKSENTRKRGESYSIYLPFKYYEDFKIFIATRNQKGAVEINGKKWAVSSRVPFPHEMALNKSIQPTPSATAD